MKETLDEQSREALVQYRLERELKRLWKKLRYWLMKLTTTQQPTDYTTHASMLSLHFWWLMGIALSHMRGLRLYLAYTLYPKGFFPMNMEKRLAVFSKSAIAEITTISFIATKIWLTSICPKQQILSIPSRIFYIRTTNWVSCNV